jgi:hypothetical protein
MVETVCENNDEGIDSDSNTIDIIIEKEGMIVAVYSSAICFISAELEKDKITVPEELHLDILQSFDTCIIHGYTVVGIAVHRFVRPFFRPFDRINTTGKSK